MDEWPLVREWIAEYEAITPKDLHEFAAEHQLNDEVAAALHALLLSEVNSVDEPNDSYLQLLEEVCAQLLSFYRSRETELQKFTLQFLPTLIYTYLSTVSRGDKKSCRCIETLLISIYNLEVMDENGKPKVVSFRLPSLAQASMYHEPLTLGPAFLTETALRRWEECNTRLVSWGPLPQVEALNAQNRLKVMTALLFVYNRQLSLLPKTALHHLCLAASRLVTQGFQIPSLSNIDAKSTAEQLPRIPVTCQFLLELTQGAYFAMFNEFYTLALQAVTDIDMRASYELMPDVMLVTGAVINSLQSNPSGQPCDGPMGISIALSPATNTLTISKSMITNASFRTKKLPDDIPIQANVPMPNESTDTLGSITEEGEGEVTAVQRGGILRSSKPKLPSFSSLSKKRDKDKDKDTGTKDKMVSMKNGSAIGEILIKKPLLKDTGKTSSRNSISIGAPGEMQDLSPNPQKKVVIDTIVEANGSLNDEKISFISDSLQNSVDLSDTHSQLTTDSLDLDTSITPRLATMQVSSV